jgi:tetratricopeptide (TPR) repeat protein
MKSKTLIFLLIFTFLLNTNSTVVLSQSISSKNSVSQANNYAKAAHEAFDSKNYIKAAENYEKAYKINGIKVYHENSIVAYLSAANNYAGEKDFANAIKYSNKVLSISPNNQSAKELLSEIYYSKGIEYYYTGQLDKAEADINNALKYAVIKDQIDKSKEAITKIKEAKSNGLSPVPQYENSSDDSIPETLDKIEKKLYGKANSSVPLLTRVNKLEKESLGKNYDGDGLIVRVDRLKRTILPELTVQTNNLYEGTYIAEIIQQSMGAVTTFGKMPITVYINDGSVKPYKRYYDEAAKEAFKEWEKASEDKIKFQFINDPTKTDLQVAWNEEFEDFPWQPKLKTDDISAEKERIKYRKANMAVQAGSMLAMVAGSMVGVPFLGTAGYLGGSLASPYLGYKGTKNEKLSPDIKINTKIFENMTEEQIKAKIKQIAMHQIGHAIGIYGHSDDPADIMYSDFKATKLSERDIKTIREIYKDHEAQKETK